MQYSTVTNFIDPKQYDYIVSIGSKCPTRMILKDLGIYKESFPFDSVKTTPELILKYLKNNEEFFPKKGCRVTDDGLEFDYFNVNELYEETIATFNRRFDRLYSALESKKRILFCYTSERDLYNDADSRNKDNYLFLEQIRTYLIEKYMYTDFTILAIHTNKYYADSFNIINYTVNVDKIYLTEDADVHGFSTQYRATLTELMRRIFRLEV
jgi:hypothetical protein